MNKKNFLCLILICFAVTLKGETIIAPFEYPTAPDSLTALPARAGYVIRHFWEKADMKKLMSDTTKFHKAFADYVGLLPYAHPDSSRLSVQDFMSPVKNDPKMALVVADLAEKEMFGPERSITNADEIYMQFIKGVLSNKKINVKSKNRYLEQIKMLNSSQVDATASQFSYITRHGATHTFYEQPGEYYLLYFHGPDTDSYGMSRLRMETDVAINNLSKSGRLKVFDIYVGEPGEGWKESVSSLPYEWEVGYSTTVGDAIDVRELPEIYLLDKDHKIMVRGLTVEHVLNIAQALNNQTSQQQ